MAVSENAQQLGWAWSAIQGAVNERANTAVLWAAVREVAAAYDLTLPPGAFAAVTELRSLAAAQRNAGEAFNQAENGQLMTQQFAGLGYNARSAADRALFPELLVQFQMVQLDDFGNQELANYTTRITWTPDMTVGEVRDQVAASAEGLAADYGVIFGGLGTMLPVVI